MTLGWAGGITSTPAQRHNLGWAGLALLLLALVHACWRPRREVWVVLSGFLVYYLFIGAGRLVGLLTLCAALGWKPRAWRAEEGVVVVALGIFAILLLVSQSTFMRYALPLAVQYYLTGVQLQPEDADLLFNLALSYIHLNQYPQAAAALERSVALKLDPDAYINLGVAYSNTGQSDKARSCFDKVLELAPDHPQAERLRRELQKGR